VDQAALALVWVLKNPNISSVVMGTSKPEQVFKSVKALDLLPKLTDEVMRRSRRCWGTSRSHFQNASSRYKV